MRARRDGKRGRYFACLGPRVKYRCERARQRTQIQRGSIVMLYGASAKLPNTCDLKERGACGAIVAQRAEGNCPKSGNVSVTG